MWCPVIIYVTKGSFDKTKWKPMREKRADASKVISSGSCKCYNSWVHLYNNGWEKKGNSKNLLHKDCGSWVLSYMSSAVVWLWVCNEIDILYFVDSYKTHPESSPEKWPLSRSWSSAQSGSSAGHPELSSCPSPVSPPWEAHVLNAELQRHTEGRRRTFLWFYLFVL